MVHLDLEGYAAYACRAKRRTANEQVLFSMR